MFQRWFKRAITADLLPSLPCSQAQLESYTFQRWIPLLGERPLHLHRKVWEYCYVTQALYERGMLQPAMHGLGFAVGQEPLTALFASRGCTIVASDLAPESADAEGWIATAQHATSLDALNQRHICPPDLFAQQVSFRYVDMRAIPDDLTGFDFLWSSCALEHLGSLQAGLDFIHECLRCLKSGGIAVHTTEYNLQSNTSTLEDGMFVLYRRQDLQRLAQQLRSAGHAIEFAWERPLNGWADQVLDQHPYKHEVHLQVELKGYRATSFGLIIRKA